jgi:hypothetical protein
VKRPRGEKSLSFLLVGIPGAGKTMWLATVHQQISLGKYPTGVHFEKESSANYQHFEQLLAGRGLLGQAGKAEPEGGEAYDLGYRFRDRDRWWRRGSSARVNLWDPSGEAIAPGGKDDLFRRRFREADGMALFLDPDPPNHMGGLTQVQDQVQQLVRFHEAMLKGSARDSGNRVPIPVAVCLPKLDLLASPPLVHRAKPWLDFLRATTGEPVTLKLLQNRSQSCDKMLPELFPDVSITRSLRSYFGNRFLFFPLTALGLDVGTDPSPPAPFGILEPLLWLLHMNGYRVFK